jgi:hypothetical protein
MLCLPALKAKCSLKYVLANTMSYKVANGGPNKWRPQSNSDILQSFNAVQSWDKGAGWYCVKGRTRHCCALTITGTDGSTRLQPPFAGCGNGEGLVQADCCGLGLPGEICNTILVAADEFRLRARRGHHA